MTTNFLNRSHQLPKIPLLGPYEAQCFSKYFKEIDILLSKRFSLGFFPDEEHITSILCELLDKNGSQLHSLSYSLSDLNKDLAKNDGLLQADISISTSDYNKNQERYHTQSDLGIVIEYKDYIEYENNFSNGVLIQAKKLFPDKYSEYTFSSKYNSFDAAQHDRLQELEKKFKNQKCGLECIKYLMYNPSLEKLPKYERQKILHQQMKIDAASIFDYTQGLNRYKELTEEQTPIINFGCLFTSIENIHKLAEEAANSSSTKEKLFKFSLGELVNSINVYQSSLSWFFVFDLMVKGIGCSCQSFLNLVRYGNESTSFSNELEIPEPKYSIKLTISAGEQEG